MPIEDLVKVFHTFVQINYEKGHDKLFYNMVNQIRAGVYQVPAESFTLTLVDLIEAQIIDVAQKFLPIIENLKDTDQLHNTFCTSEDKIRLIWSLLVLEKGHQLLTPSIVTTMLSPILIESLDPLHLKLFLQLLNLVLAVPHLEGSLDHQKIYENSSNLSIPIKQEILSQDPSSKTPLEIRQKIKEVIDPIFSEFSKKKIGKRGRFKQF